MKPTILRPIFELPVDNEIFILGKGNQSLAIDIYTNSISITTIGNARTLMVVECIKHLLSLMNSNQNVLFTKSELMKYLDPWFKNICVESMPRRIDTSKLAARVRDKVAVFKIIIQPIADKLRIDSKPDLKDDGLSSKEPEQKSQPKKVRKHNKPFRAAKNIDNLDERLTQLYVVNNETAESVAEKLGLSRPTVYNHLKRLGLKKRVSDEHIAAYEKNEAFNHPITLRNGKIVNISYTGQLSNRDIDLIASHLKYLNEE